MDRIGLINDWLNDWIRAGINAIPEKELLVKGYEKDTISPLVYSTQKRQIAHNVLANIH